MRTASRPQDISVSQPNLENTFGNPDLLERHGALAVISNIRIYLLDFWADFGTESAISGYLGGSVGYLVDIWVSVGGLRLRENETLADQEKTTEGSEGRVARLGVTSEVPQLQRGHSR
eukprot:scaffold92383_cov33-Tisochrysis_lutea.AAC.3